MHVRYVARSLYSTERGPSSSALIGHVECLGQLQLQQTFSTVSIATQKQQIQNRAHTIIAFERSTTQIRPERPFDEYQRLFLSSPRTFL